MTTEVLEIALLTVLLSRRQKRGDRKERCGCAIFSPSVDREANTTIDIIPPFWRYNIYDTHHALLQEMRLNDTQAHFTYLRMTSEHFEHFMIVGPLLVRRENYWSVIRANITPAERLALTIKYLATGNSQISLSFNTRFGKSTVSVYRIFRETCEVL